MPAHSTTRLASGLSRRASARGSSASGSAWPSGRCPPRRSRQVVRLTGARDHHDLDLAGVEHRGRAHVHQLAAGHRPAVAVAAVADQLHAAGDRARLALAGRSPACRACRRAERDLGADAGARSSAAPPADRRWRTRRRCRGPASSIAAEHRHGVHRAAGGAVVVVVEQHHRAAAGAPCARARHRVVPAARSCRRRPRALPTRWRAVRRNSAARQRHVAVGDDDSRETGVADVGMRKADEDAGAPARLRLSISRQRACSSRFGRVVAALAHHVRQHRPVAPGHRRPAPGPRAWARIARPARRPVS